MRILIFCHSLVSDWNHGNAHFLRGITAELMRRGHDVHVYEPAESWSRCNLEAEYGQWPIVQFHRRYPCLESTRYDAAIDLDATLKDADLVLVHEWNEPDLVARIGRHRAEHDHYRLLFHDTHHRSVTAPDAMAAYDLRHYDGVLAFGETVRDIYLQRGWTKQAWTWHEAADTKVFRPLPKRGYAGDVVWIGNWGDDERSDTLRRFLFGPIAKLGLKATVYGVRYPPQARRELRAAGIEYRGWLPNYRVPLIFSRYRMTVHVPRRPYLTHLPGVPTIRPFEALACGTPLICAEWEDGSIFRPGVDYLVAHDGDEMAQHMHDLLAHPDRAAALGECGRQTVIHGHTCVHRVDELLAIYHSLD